MRAAWYYRKGTARDVLTIGEMPVQEPSPGEVLVRVMASGVNPTDTKSRGGWRGNTEMPFPLIVPHQDGAGVVERVGAGVPPSRLGDRVWLYEAQWKRPFGTAAEYVALPARQAVPLPDNTTFDEGAGLGIPATTAHRCLFQDGAIGGQTVFVAGGAGAVGYYAVQLAKWGGAGVIASVSTESQMDLVQGAGADQVVLRSADLAAQIEDLTHGRGVNRIVEVSFGSNLAADVPMIAANGVISTYSSDAVHDPVLPFYGLSAKGVTVHFTLVYVMPAEAHEAAARDITACLQGRGLRHSISRRFDLGDIPAAHEALEAGKLNGKAIITNREGG